MGDTNVNAELDFSFPQLPRDASEEMHTFLLELRGFLRRTLVGPGFTNTIITTVTIDGKADFIELVVDGSEYGDDGNWRFIIVSGNLKMQKRVSGSWEDVNIYSY